MTRPFIEWEKRQKQKGEPSDFPSELELCPFSDTNFIKQMDLERFVNQTKKHLFQNQSEIEEIKILVSGKLVKDWEAVARAKGVTLQDYLVNLANKDVEAFSAERNKTQDSDQSIKGFDE